MKKLITLSLFALALNLSAQDMGTIEFVSEELNGIFAKDAKVEKIVEGCQFTEGPLWIEKEQMLLFSDVPANTIYKWTGAGGKEEYLKPSGYTDSASRGGFMGSNGLYLTKDGELLICQHGDGRVAKMDAPITAPEENYVTVAGEYDGKRLNSPNDLVMSSKGDLYFTDPAYGFEGGLTDPKKELSFQGVYRMDKSGNVILQDDAIPQPNGLAIFPDKKTMIVASTDGPDKGWFLYDIDKNGDLKNKRVFYNVASERGMGGCDGLKIDKSGNVFATGPDGVWIFTKKGKLIGRIKFNRLSVANLAFTPDEKTMYITATNYVFRVNLK
ncbi:SMP-30/gluconolactonase/LRE family protein [Flavobacteriaceae bacterium XHP0103]|uniref:SMP-30/gluconolactonase/LRE family protein n=1 Tax=Marixanthotalea marina TaxID=2844359 RepID=UPI00298A06F6|nr:SMP-30/gluconolactonase/LRE family protein [Marixanthotalea marina]MBU3822760.1 SMP-30/gluconolactonase/LRE family protein [Marixanthotalea marina]